MKPCAVRVWGAVGCDGAERGQAERSGDVERDAQRRRDPDDRRRHVVEITASGRKALARAEQALDGLEEDVLDGLSADERATLRELLARAVADVPAPA